MFKTLLVTLLLVSLVASGPLAFQACMQGLGVYLGGSAAALSTCAAAGFPPLVISCVAGVCGVPGTIYLGTCLVALFAPTP
jgi:hypothetical protein